MSLSSRFFKNLSKNSEDTIEQMDYLNERETNDQIKLVHEVIVIDDDRLNDESKNTEDEVNKSQNLKVLVSEATKRKVNESCSNLFSQFAYESSSISSKSTIISSKKRCMFSNTTNLLSKKHKSTQIATTKTKIVSTNQKSSKLSKMSPKPLSELSVHELNQIRRKWHNLIIIDGSEKDSRSLEDARFHMLVAARLHARCHEPAVRKCMIALHDAGVLTCTALAVCDPTVLASLLVNVPHYNVKAQQLVQAAKWLISRFYGQVPESKEDLMTIPGIGPVFADLLSVINTRAVHSSANDDGLNV
jgi:endonuclease III